MDRGPSCHERYVGYGVYSLNGDGSDCRDAVGGIGADSGGLSEAAREYSEALTELAPLLAETSSYYHDERYRLDGCERGRELHSSLVSAFSRFDAADRTLELTSRRIEEELVAARLVELAADPAQHDAYVVDLTMERARGVVAAAEPLRVAHGRLVGDDGTFRTAAADLAEALTQLEQTPRAGDERFRARASAAADATRAVILRLDGEAFSSSERFRLEGGSFADEVFGSPQRLLASYNALVEAYNAL